MNWADGISKMKKRVRLNLSQMRGKIGEDTYKMQSQMRGNEVQRTGRGHDFRERKAGSKGKWNYVEVKSSSTATVSKLQKKGVKKGKVKVVRPHWIG